LQEQRPDHKSVLLAALGERSSVARLALFRITYEDANMDFIVVLDPTKGATRAVASNFLPYYLQATEGDGLRECPTLRCTMVDTANQSFVRLALIPDEQGVIQFVWVPTDIILTILERAATKRTFVGFAPESIH
jgi:hypothetical protein